MEDVDIAFAQLSERRDEVRARLKCIDKDMRTVVSVARCWGYTEAASSMEALI